MQSTAKLRLRGLKIWTSKSQTILKCVYRNTCKAILHLFVYQLKKRRKLAIGHNLIFI